MPSYKVVLPRAPTFYDERDQNALRSEIERALTSSNVLSDHAAQHEFGGYDELALAESQIIDGAILARVASAETITGLWSFSRSTNPPFAVNAGAALVTNLDADKLDGQEGTYYTDLDNILINVVGTPTYTSAQEGFALQGSPGRISGGGITDAGGATVDVAAGQGFIRSSDSGIVDLLSIEWSAVSGQAIPADSTRWVLVEYNAGSPQVSFVSALSGNEGEDAFILGTIVNEGGTLHIAEVHEDATSGVYNLNHMLREVLGITRADALGGLIINETGTRNLTVTEGEIYWGSDEFDYSAIDTSGADTFETYYQTSGTWTHATGVSQWDNDNYNDTTSGLVSMTNNRYANLWFYADIEGELIMVYGTAQYVTLGLAQAEQPPSVPARVSNHCLLLGRFIFQKGGATAEEIDSAFSTVLSTVGVTDHGNLAGLSDDDHVQYVLADGTRNVTGALIMESDLDVQGTLTGVAGTFSGAVTGSNLNIANWDTAYGWGDHAGLYDALGAAATVQTNLNTHAALTTTAHGLGESAFHPDSYFGKVASNENITGVWTFVETLSIGSISAGGNKNLQIRSYGGGAGIFLDSGYNGTPADSTIYLRDGSTEYWKLGKDSSNDFFLYDTIGTQNVIAITSNGDMTLSPAGGDTTVTGTLTVTGRTYAQDDIVMSASQYIIANTSDGSDNSATAMSGGGGLSTGRGGYIVCYGNEHATRPGAVTIRAATGASGDDEILLDGAVKTGALTINGALNHDGSTAGFYATAPVAQQTGVAVTAAAIHAALVNLGLITA